MSLKYLALTDGMTTLVLTDGTNYTLEEGWNPTLALDTDQRTVVESIPVNILGATTSGGTSDPARVRRNLVALLSMLRQIERGQNGEGGVVRLVYTSPNSAPARRVAVQVTKWDATAFLPAINAAENLVQNEINVAVLTLEHRVPWVHQTYLYDNGMTGTAWATTPSPLAVNGTAAWGAITGMYGGLGAITLTKSSGANAAIYSNSITTAVTNGVPVRFTFTIGYSSGITAIRFRLIENGAITSMSDLAETQVTGTAAITDGRTITATVTPTATGTARLYWEVAGPAAATVTIAEVIRSADETTWHPANSEVALAGTGGAVLTAGLPATITWPVASPALAPVDLTMFPQAQESATRAGEGVVIATSGVLIAQNYPQGAVSAPFSSVAATNAPATGANVLRYTPAGTTQVLMPIEIGVSSLTNYKYDIWAVVRNTSPTTVFQIQPVARSSANTTYRISGAKATIPPQATTTNPVPIKIGEMYVSARQAVLELWIEASAASGALDLSVVAIAEHRDDMRAVKYRATDTTGVGTNPALIATSRWLTAPAPTLETVNAALSFAVTTVTDDVPLFWSRGTALNVLWLGVSGASWRQTNAAGTLVTVGISATRPPAFDSPI